MKNEDAKLCVDCAYYKVSCVNRNYDHCLNKDFATRNVIRGEIDYACCMDARAKLDMCGPLASAFKSNK